MSRNEQRRARKQRSLEHYSEILEAFCEEYDVSLNVFGEGIHWRLENPHAILDCWPTTGKYWIKQTDIGVGLAGRMHEKGELPYECLPLVAFLEKLFLAGKNG